MEIVTNMASKRKTEMAVNFDRGDRNFGSDAYALVSRKPKQTFTKITTMLGTRFFFFFVYTGYSALVVVIVLRSKVLYS